MRNVEKTGGMGTRFRACWLFLVSCLAAGQAWPQQPPPASGARILLVPRTMISGERATLAVLDVNGRLTPGVKIKFSNGDEIVTDATGRALFVAPLNSGVIFASLEGRPGRISTAVGPATDESTLGLYVSTAPRFASLSDRFEFAGHGFCGDADKNRVTVGGKEALVLASSPGSLVVLPPQDLEPGIAAVAVTCGKKTSRPFSVSFLGLDLQADSSPLQPGQKRTLTVRVEGTAEKVRLEARNLAPDIAEMEGGTPVRAFSSGGTSNVAEFHLTGKKHGSFLISIRLVPSPARIR